MVDDIVFEGIDSWNRPTFKSTTSKARYCCTDKLLDHGSTETEVLEQISEKDLVYKGNKFESEPMGTREKIRIVRA